MFQKSFKQLQSSISNNQNKFLFWLTTFQTVVIITIIVANDRIANDQN